MPPPLQSRVPRRLGASTRACRNYAVSRCAAPIDSAFSDPFASTRQYASASSVSSIVRLPDDYVPPTKPPSGRRPEERKAQLLRTYTSLLRSTPLMLIFQHNNLTAVEWAAIRRELRSAQAAIPPSPASAEGQQPVDIAPKIQMQVIRTRIFSQALKVDEFFDPSAVTTPSTAGAKKPYTHDLSLAAYEAVKAVDKAIPDDSIYAQLAPLITGQIALLTFPAVSPQHLAAALSVLSPSPPAFSAPTRRKNPGYYDLTTQSGLQKLLLLGARIENRAFDLEGVKWLGGIEGGLDGLRAELAAVLQSSGLGMKSALEGVAKSFILTMEVRRTMMDDGQESEKKL